MSVREASKLVGGSALVYAIVTGLPATSSDATCAPGTGVFAGSVAAAGTAESGEQLKATYLEGADGSRQFLAWHDTVRDVDCAFTMAADGTWRCLPGGAEAGRFFADAACTQPLALVPTGCTPPAYATASTSVCGPRSSTRVFALGERFTGPVVYWIAGGMCPAAPSIELTLRDVYVVGDELAASAFVQATPQTE